MSFLTRFCSACRALTLSIAIACLALLICNEVWTPLPERSELTTALSQENLALRDTARPVTSQEIALIAKAFSIPLKHFQLDHLRHT